MDSVGLTQVPIHESDGGMAICIEFWVQACRITVTPADSAIGPTHAENQISEEG